MAAAAVLPPQSALSEPHPADPADNWLSKSPAGYQDNPAPQVVPFAPIKVGTPAGFRNARAAAKKGVEAYVICPGLSQGPTVWYSDLSRDKYEYILSAENIADLDRAIARVKAQGFERIEAITKQDFELGDFGTWLGALHQDLLYGVGIRVVRGLPVERWGLR